MLEQSVMEQCCLFPFFRYIATYTVLTLFACSLPAGSPSRQPWSRHPGWKPDPHVCEHAVNLILQGRGIGPVKRRNYASYPLQAGAHLLKCLLATALFRCWHIIVFFAGWSTVIVALNERGYGLCIDPALLTVLGTLLAFVISYRTTSSFQRYDEARSLWSSIVYATRNFARTLWFHVPDPKPDANLPEEERMKRSRELRAKMLVEKKTVINLLGAYAVALKHYLRGEDGIYYEDLYHCVKFLCPYTLPPGLPTSIESNCPLTSEIPRGSASNERSPVELPQPVTASRGRTSQSTISEEERPSHPLKNLDIDTKEQYNLSDVRMRRRRFILPRNEEQLLFPASMPPKYSWFDFFPFSLMMGYFAKRGKFRGKRAARLRAKMQSAVVSHNIPLEISLYLSSYIAALQNSGLGDVGTIGSLTDALNLLVQCLTSMERILTTPIPFSYAAHLWTVTVIYSLLLPSMIWTVLGRSTVLATVVCCFFYFGFLVLGDIIENPFGYDMNDLDLDHFTDTIIKEELRAVTSVPPPDPSHWVFAPENDAVFSKDSERVGPNVWVERGPEAIMRALRGSVDNKQL